MAARASKRGAPRERDPGKPRDETEARPVTTEPGAAHDGAMTTSHHIELATGTRWSMRRALESLPQAALAALAFALISGAWVAFFTFVPLDFTPLQGR